MGLVGGENCLLVNGWMGGCRTDVPFSRFDDHWFG
jgi:hypothetical protein